MSIQTFSRKKITEGIQHYKPYHASRVRILYVDEHIDESSFKNACKLYSNLRGTGYDDVIVIERFKGDNDKLLPMVSNTMFITPIGQVEVNDQLRNDFCDEDDDFFIDDAGYREDMCIYDHLMMLQCVLDDFKVLSIQVADQSTAIIRELAAAVSELMRERNALIIVCCDVSQSSSDSIREMEKMIDEKQYSRLLNYLNTGDAGVIGPGPLASGVLIAETWELVNHFISFKEGTPGFLAGCATLREFKK